MSTTQTIEERTATRDRLENVANWHDRQAVLSRRNRDIAGEKRHEGIAWRLRLQQR